MTWHTASTSPDAVLSAVRSFAGRAQDKAYGGVITALAMIKARGVRHIVLPSVAIADAPCVLESDALLCALSRAVTAN